MPSTFNFIGKINLTDSNNYAVTFSNIPQSYTDLYILTTTRDTNTGSVNGGLGLTFNDSAANKSVAGLYGISSGTPAGYTGSVMRGDYTTASNSTNANSFGVIDFYIPQYASSSVAKNTIGNGAAEDNTAAMFMGWTSNTWGNTAAITSITISNITGLPFASGSNFYLYGISKAGTGSGTATAKFVRSFLTPGTTSWTAPTGVTSVEVLVVAGGGGGGTGTNGGTQGGGGGAGGLIYNSSFAVTPSSSYTVTVGAGGSANNPGGNSVFASLTATGGGRGGSESLGQQAGSGGSGGGAQGRATSAFSGGAGTAGQGNAGGNNGPTFYIYSGGGGGGAGGVGENAVDLTSQGSTGGIGLSYFGTFYAGGGGGGRNGTAASGGNGSGGNGAFGTTNATAGTANTGGGGGGGGNSSVNTAGQAGGSGIVILRWTKP